MARRSLLDGALRCLKASHLCSAAAPATQNPWTLELPRSFIASPYALQFVRPAHAQAQAMAADYPYVAPMKDTCAADAPGPSSLADASKAAHAAPAQPAPSPFKKTFYKRHLPSPPATAFSSPEGGQRSRVPVACALCSAQLPPAGVTTNGLLQLLSEAP